MEDSLVLLYRSSPKYDWAIQTDVVQNFLGSNNNKIGNFTINHLQKGEYAFGIWDFDKVDSPLITGSDSCIVLSVPVIPSTTKTELKIHPNPADQSATVEWEPFAQQEVLVMRDTNGRLVFSGPLHAGEGKRIIPLSGLPDGNYVVEVAAKGKHITGKLILAN